MEEINCIICGSLESQVLCLKGKFSESVRTVICEKCSFVYTNPRMSQEEVRYYYENKYNKFFKKEDLKSVENKNEKRFNFLKENFDIKDNLNVLEIGCGKGYWLKYLKDKNFCVKGVEPNYEYYQYAKENFNLDIINCFIEDFNFGNEKYSLIIMFHLLEHIRNPENILCILRNHLQEEGILYIEVPNILRNPGFDWKENFFRSVHFYNFTFFTLELLLKKCGFSIIKKDPSYANLRVLAKAEDKIDFHYPSIEEVKYYIRKIKNHLFF